MKNIKMIHFVVALSLLQTPYVFAAETNFLQQTNQEAANDPSLQPLVCKKVPAQCFGSFCDKDRLVDDPACVQENKRRAQARAGNARVTAQTERLTGGGDATSLKAPMAPEYKCGTLSIGTPEYYNCQRDYDAKNKIYRQDLDAYNKAQAQLKEVQATAENKALEEQKNKSATSTLAEIKAKNDKGASKYSKVQKVTKALSDAAATAGAVCAATCGTPGGGCCGAAPGFFATAAAFRLLSSLAKRQVKSHNDSSLAACQSQNQLSSSQQSCTPPSDPTQSTTVSIDPATGKCSPAESEICKDAPIQPPAPAAVREAFGKSAFAGGKKLKELEILPDGSVKAPNGKIFSASDFQDEKSLIAAGLTPAQAKDVLASLGPLGSGLTAASKYDLKAPAFNSNANNLFGGGGGSSVVSVNKPADGKSFKDKVEAVKEEERKPASEGLAKDFNGELIGVSGDDIFLMMNRRYKLKNAQDSFIAQDINSP